MYRLKSLEDVHNKLGLWLYGLNHERNKTIHLLQILKEKSMTDLLESALSCHLPHVLNTANKIP